MPSSVIASVKSQPQPVYFIAAWDISGISFEYQLPQAEDQFPQVLRIVAGKWRGTRTRPFSRVDRRQRFNGARGSDQTRHLSGERSPQILNRRSSEPRT